MQGDQAGASVSERVIGIVSAGSLQYEDRVALVQSVGLLVFVRCQWVIRRVRVERLWKMFGVRSAGIFRHPLCFRNAICCIGCPTRNL